MYILGIHNGHHDASACVFRDYELVAAVSKATRDLAPPFGPVPAGSVAGMHFEWTAWADGRPLLVYHSYWTLGDDIDPAYRLPRDSLVSNTEVHAKVRCGSHRLGYSLFYGVWEFIYEKIVFFF